MKFHLWICGAPWDRMFGWGFWCGDLLCVKPIPQNKLCHREWEEVREEYLSPIDSNVILAFLKWLGVLLRSIGVVRNE